MKQKEIYMLSIKKNQIEQELFTLNLRYNLGIKSHAEIRLDTLTESKVIPNEEGVYIIK